MPLTPIKKNSGLTPSEKCLINLAEKSFLNLWSYANLYKQKGKELCDLLVVFGDHIIVFSDKTIAYPTGEDADLNWSRWYKKAIKKSADQVKGAIRWIENFPDEIYMDAACTDKFQLKFPPKNKRKVTGIVVALGAKQACIGYFKGGSGSLAIIPALKGNDHTTPAHPSYKPFSIGDINPEGNFIHVFDDVTLGIVMKEFDTVSDLTAYLDKKESFLRSGRLTSAHGEENILALYMKFLNEDGDHDFMTPEGNAITDGNPITLEQGLYDELQIHPSYILKKEADGISYLWDNLIKAFTTPIMEATAFGLYGHDYGLAEHEEAVRHMASENRVYRRMLGNALHGAIEKGKNIPRFGRAIIPGPTDRKRDTGYVFLTVAYPEDFELEGGYEQYRQARTGMLRAYCLGYYQRNQYLKRIIGISTEPPSEATGRQGSSEDLVFLEPEEWTEELDNEANELCQAYDVLQEGRVQMSHMHDSEYPELPEGSLIMVSGNGEKFIIIEGGDDNDGDPPPNRHQRRAAKAKKKRQ